MFTHSEVRGYQMARSYITKHGKKVRQIMNAVTRLRQKDIADEIGESQQVVSYRIRNKYPEIFEEMITILEMAGYEVVERG